MTVSRTLSAASPCRPLSRTAGFAAVALLLCLMQTGCVYRRMTVRSDPPGALVLVDGQEVGYTPCSIDFTYYGTREIMLVKDGYETLTVMQKLKTPWYQYPGIEFFADNLSPHKITNRQEFSYRMQPQAIVPTQELIDRANSLRSDTQVGQ